jgi:hypothetical protein
MVEGVAGVARGPQYRGCGLRATVTSARARRMTVRITERTARVLIVVV